MTSVFAHETAGLFTSYGTTIQFLDRTIAGIPSDPRLIEGWLLKNAGVSRREQIGDLFTQTIREIGIDLDSYYPEGVPEGTTPAQIAKKIAATSQTTVFKRDPRLGLYIESRQLKACLKEAVNVCFPWEAGYAWGKVKRTAAPRKPKKGEDTADLEPVVTESRGKSPRNYFIEQITINPLRIPLGRAEPDGVDLSISHVVGPQGPRSALSYYEYVDEARVSLVIEVLRDSIEHASWATCWEWAGRHGLGAKRSQDQGRFEVIEWERLEEGQMQSFLETRRVPLAAPALDGLLVGSASR